MDRTDRFINNRAPKLLVLCFLLLLVLAAAGGWFLSGKLADSIVSEQIAAMLSVSGGGNFLETPDAQAIAQGEAMFRKYGVRADMEPSLMPGYGDVRMCLFGVILGCSGVICLTGLCFSLRQVDRIYCQLEALRAECFSIAEQLQEHAQLRGEDFGCVRRICEGVNLIAKRMNHLSGSLHSEKQFLKEFLTDFSHQMKTSLAVVRLNSDMLSELEQLPAAKKEQLSEEIAMHLDGMEMLVISALKLAKLGADAVVYEKQEADLSETCRIAAERLLPLMREKQILLNIPDVQGILLPHDAVWLCEAIGNLLKNAADHGECSTITMELEEIPGAVKLSVTDDGRGILQSEIPHLFERFGKKSNNATMQSAGVGLAIAKQIIEAHNGEICVYSEIGRGTRFEILFLR